MIVVSISSTELRVDGHAGYAKEGQDIICSAVTMLTFNLIHSLEALTDDLIEYEAENPGHVYILIKNLSEKGKLLVDSFFIGVNDVAIIYPEYVQIQGMAPNGR